MDDFFLRLGLLLWLLGEVFGFFYTVDQLIIYVYNVSFYYVYVVFVFVATLFFLRVDLKFFKNFALAVFVEVVVAHLWALLVFCLMPGELLSGGDFLVAMVCNLTPRDFIVRIALVAWPVFAVAGLFYFRAFKALAGAVGGFRAVGWLLLVSCLASPLVFLSDLVRLVAVVYAVVLGLRFVAPP